MLARLIQMQAYSSTARIINPFVLPKCQTCLRLQIKTYQLQLPIHGVVTLLLVRP
jgi:hypothetical protein